MSTRLRALVLAAGFGTRLEPLTHHLPKPLLPVAGLPVAALTLQRLAAIGCEVAALNLHHLGASIREEFGRRWGRMPLVYSVEDEIQGTLGALHPLREAFAGADAVILVNGDSLCRWPLRRLVRRHLATGAAATLLLHHRRPDAALGGGVGVDRRGRIVALRDVAADEPARRHVFAGVHVLSPRLLERVEPGFGDIVEGLYQPLLSGPANAPSLQAVVTARPWHDLGTPARYLDAVLAALGSPWPWPLSRIHGVRSYCSPLATRADSVELVRSTVERGARLGAGARLEDSVVLDGASIGRGVHLRRVVVGPAANIPDAAQIEGRLVTRADPGRSLVEGQSQMGDLVYTPL
ncbi:MAG: NDP-sugar synthase [Acidobacteriota bacterium]